MLPGVSAVEVTLVANGRKYRLGSDVVTVPSSQIVLAVRGASGPVRLDGTTKHLDSTGGILPLDLRRSTGYHRLTVKGDDYWFATDDAKLKLAGVEEMLADLRGFGTGWTGQVAFSDGTGVRDPHVVYSWLDRRADNILAAAREILRSPRTEQLSRRALSRRGGAGVDVPATVRLLRSEPSRFLEEHAAGVITVGERHYMPQRVVVRRRHSSIDTSANRRVIQVLAALRRLADEVYEYTDVRAQQTQCLKWRNDADRLLPPGLGQRLLRFSGLANPSGRSLIEDTDHRYELTFRMHQEVFDQFGWSPASGHQSRSSYVSSASRIYGQPVNRKTSPSKPPPKDSESKPPRSAASNVGNSSHQKSSTATEPGSRPLDINRGFRVRSESPCSTEMHCRPEESDAHRHAALFERPRRAQTGIALGERLI